MKRFQNQELHFSKVEIAERKFWRLIYHNGHLATFIQTEYEIALETNEFMSFSD